MSASQQFHRGSSGRTSEYMRSCERATVTRVVLVEGIGQPDDPVREVSYWYDDDGWLIARRDGWEESQQSGPEGGER